MARWRWLPLVASVALLGGCTAGPNSDELDRLHQQAQDALGRYDKAVTDAGGQQRFVPVGDLTGQIGDWEPSNGDNNKQALLAGRVEADTALPETVPAPGTVVWEGGATLTVPLLSAAEALRQLVGRPEVRANCANTCTPLHVTAARLTTVRIQTTRGTATVPAWEYTLEGTAVRVTRVGVAGQSIVTMTPPAFDPTNRLVGIAIQSATTTSAGRQLTVSFTGAPGPANQHCGADYTAEAVESANAVVVIVIRHTNANPFGGACNAVGAFRTATVDLAQPLGDRAVLTATDGLPVPVTITA
jgi:hypothetical protein